MKLIARLLMCLMISGCFVGLTSCGVLRPATQAALDGATEWWNTGGKDKVLDIAKDAAKSAADNALKAAETYTDKKAAEVEAQLVAAGFDPKKLDSIEGLKNEIQRMEAARIEENKRRESEGKPPKETPFELYGCATAYALWQMWKQWQIKKDKAKVKA